MKDKADFRKQILFRELSDAELDVIGHKIVVEDFSEGKSIFREGEPTRGIYLVKSGTVEISKTTHDGWKQRLAILSANQIFGELSIIENKKTHGADATAIEPTQVYRIRTEDFKALERTNANMMYKITKTIARITSNNVHAMNEKMLRLLISY
jgi:CRP-like cAMP-binding protein